MKPFVIHADAERELRKSAAWYSRELAGLGSDFLLEFEKAIQRVRENPFSYAAEDDSETRNCPLRRFPFAIVYLNEPTYIWVVAVADLRRRPQYWARRLI